MTETVTTMVLSAGSDTPKFFDGDTSAQELAFAVAALQAMPSSSVALEPTLVPTAKMLPSTIAPILTKSFTSDKGNVLPQKEESLGTEQSPGSGTTELVGVGSGSVTTTNKTTTCEAPVLLSTKVECDAEDASTRLQRSRERNREHARRTRLRKKAQLQALQGKYKGMLAEKQTLEQKLQDRSIASILLGLSTTSTSNDDEDASHPPAEDVVSSLLREDTHSSEVVTCTRRKRGSPEISAPVTPLTVSIDGVPTAISCKSHINWKSGTYSDDQGLHKQMTAEELETLRRERNRMHAKMTRDRKKCFIATMEKAIDELEQELARMRSIVCRDDSEQGMDEVLTTPDLKAVASMVTPELTALPCPDEAPSSCTESVEASMEEPTAKRVCHGFSLDG